MVTVRSRFRTWWCSRGRLGSRRSKFPVRNAFSRRVAEQQRKARSSKRSGLDGGTVAGGIGRGGGWFATTGLGTVMDSWRPVPIRNLNRCSAYSPYPPAQAPGHRAGRRGTLHMSAFVLGRPLSLSIRSAGPVSFQPGKETGERKLAPQTPEGLTSREDLLLDLPGAGAPRVAAAGSGRTCLCQTREGAQPRIRPNAGGSRVLLPWRSRGRPCGGPSGVPALPITEASADDFACARRGSWPIAFATDPSRGTSCRGRIR